MPLILVFLLFVPQLGETALNREQALGDLQQLVRMIEDDYGPLHQKEEKLGLRLGELTRAYEKRINATPPGEDPAYQLVRFAAEFQDTHFSVRLPSKAEASLGFTVDLVEGRALIDSIDRTRLPEAGFPFSVGDELTSLDGLPALAAAKQLEAHAGMGNPETTKRLGVMGLTHRRARSLPPPSGPALLGIRRFGSEVEEQISLPWASSGESERPAALLPTAGIKDMCNEQSQIAPPPGAEAVPGVPFTAFTYPTERGRVGFLRIPHYFPVNSETGEEEAALRFAQYEATIRRFEQETVGLVIDQNYNCGGSILVVNKLVSLFAREPFQPAAFRFRASQGQLEGLGRHLAKFDPSHEGHGRLARVIESIRLARERGLFETDPIPLLDLLEVKLSLPGTDWINPNPVRYTKPVVLLVNELSGSGGDLFPSLMQDLGLATLLGQRTMGAGGHLWNDPPLRLTNSGAMVNLTRSLIVRRNGALIENEGVKPDAPYALRREDLLHGGRNLLRASTSLLLQKL